MNRYAKSQKSLVLAVIAVSLLYSPQTSYAQSPAAGVTIVCPATGPGIGVCAALGIILHEAVQKLNGNEAFGENGEVMKLLKAPVNIVSENFDAANNESGDLAKALRATTGISVADIQENDSILGGENSEAHKVCDAIAGLAGGKC